MIFGVQRQIARYAQLFAYIPDKDHFKTMYQSATAHANGTAVCRPVARRFGSAPGAAAAQWALAFV